MPSRPYRLCTQPGCSALTKGGRCDEHERERERRRGSAAKRGYDRRWRNLRKRILARDPVCVRCGTRPARDVDHIVPKAKGGSDAESNLRGLCPSCHSRVTMEEFGNPSREGVE